MSKQVTSIAGLLVRVTSATGSRPTTSTETLTVRVPLSIRRHGGRKQVRTPDGQTWAPRSSIDSTLVKALARAFRWRKLLETGAYSSITEIAASEKINPSYVARVLRMTLLAPEIVHSILDGTHDPDLTLPKLMKPFPVEWEKQVQASQVAEVASPALAPTESTTKRVGSQGLLTKQPSRSARRSALGMPFDRDQVL